MVCRQVLVVGELQGGSLREATLSAISCAHEIAGQGGEVSLLLLGENLSQACEQARTLPLARVLCGDDPIFAHNLPEHLTPTLCAVATQHHACAIVLAASAYGKDLAPRVAARMHAGYAPDILGVCQQDPQGPLGPLYKRSMCAERVHCLCRVHTSVHVVTARQSAFPPAKRTTHACPVEHISIVAPSAAAGRITLREIRTIPREQPDLGEARVVITGGRPLKGQWQFLLEPLAQHLHGALGATRALCDAGYAPAELQIGQTGRVVAPALYVAIGLSGAIQHVAGMQDSRVIVAINQDPDAPIMHLADYRLVADLFTAVPALLTELEKIPSPE